MLCYSLIKILKIKWQWVLVAAVATIASVFATNAAISNPVFRPLIPMVVGIISLSVITLFDKGDDDNREWTLSAWSLQNR